MISTETKTESRQSYRTSSRYRRGGATAAMVGLTCLATTAIAVFWGVNNLGDENADNNNLSSEPDWHEVLPISFDITIVASGELNARDQLNVKSQVEGKASIIEIVDEGATVSQGDPIVKLADDEIRDKIEQQELAVEKAQTEEIAAKENLEISKSEAESLRKADEVKLALADLELAKWMNGTVKEKTSELSINLIEARDNLIIAKRTAEEAEKLFEEQFISKSELDDDRLKLKKAEAAVKTAELAIKVYNDYTLPQEEKKSNSDVEQAKAALTRTIRKNAANLAKSTNAYESAARTRELREDSLANLKEQLELTTILAPTDGLVVYASSVGSSRYRRTEPITQGSEVIFNQSIIILPDTTHMVANLKVNESRLPQVKAGQKVSIRINALKDTPIEGTVSNISVMADSASYWNPDVRQYEVTVDLPPNINETISKSLKKRRLKPDDATSDSPKAKQQKPSPKGKQRPLPSQTRVGNQKTQFVAAKADKPPKGSRSPDAKKLKKAGKGSYSATKRPRSDTPSVVVTAGNGKGSQLAIKPGMRCSGELYIGHVENTLAVPVHAVYTEGKQRFVYVPAEANQVRRQHVKVGQASEVYVEITEGLKPGDQVLLRKPEPGEINEGDANSQTGESSNSDGKK